MSARKGYEKYVANRLPEIKEGLNGIEQGQSPETLFITCSDSRICPNELTSTKQGELFVIRNAGNSIPHSSEQKGDADAATLEYAVKALGVKEIVVCGHSHCGAVSALVAGVDPTALPKVGDYLSRLESFKMEAIKDDPTIETVIKRNVKAQLNNILSYDFVKEAVDAGKLTLHGWLYHLEKGEVEFLD
jgi:carbonic anhydrase